MQSHVALLNAANPRLKNSALQQELDRLIDLSRITLRREFDNLNSKTGNIHKKINFYNVKKEQLLERVLEKWLGQIRMAIDVYPDGQQDSFLIYVMHLLLGKLGIHYTRSDDWVLKHFLNRFINLRIAFLDDTDFLNWMIDLTKGTQVDETKPTVLSTFQSEYVLKLAGKYHIKASAFLLFLAPDEKLYKTPESEYILARAFYKIQNEEEINKLVNQLNKQWDNHFFAQRAIAGLRSLQKKYPHSTKYDSALNSLLFATGSKALNKREKRSGDLFLQKKLDRCQTARDIACVVDTYANHPMVKSHRNPVSKLFADCFFSDSYKNFIRASEQQLFSLKKK